jgi:hypothetical protein
MSYYEHQQYGQPQHGYQQYGYQQYGQPQYGQQPLNTSLAEFPKGTIVSYAPLNGQQASCMRKCTPFIKDEITNRHGTNIWKEGKYFEVHNKDRVRYEKRNENGLVVDTIYTDNTNSPIYNPIENQRNKDNLEVRLNSLQDGGVFNLKRFLKIFKPKKTTKPTTPKKTTKPTTPKKTTKPTTPKKTTKPTTPKKTTKPKNIHR